ncbi:GNAT family N-acetyltransferase [Pseudoalteromonas piscicida]|uniref:GNAT family N-acetyltransferase n=1 Tax=Pseudoalteromonas piscicida TaxID=43662 RepID=UPI0030C93432
MILEKYEMEFQVTDWGAEGRITVHEGCREVGYLAWSVGNNRLRICDLMIHDLDDRQKGIGSQLIHWVKAVAYRYQVTALWGYTASDDYQVHSFYRKHDFVISDVDAQGCVNFMLNWHNTNS